MIMIRYECIIVIIVKRGGSLTVKVVYKKVYANVLYDKRFKTKLALYKHLIIYIKLNRVRRYSNCISWASVACLKKSQAIPMHSCRDMVCDRYTQKYMQNTKPIH